MRPSASELIDSIAEALDTRVAPHVTDPWAASTLRSIRGLLAHLSVRLDMEIPMLTASNADLRALLSNARATLASTSTSRILHAQDLDGVLARPWRLPDEMPTSASLDEENRALNEGLEQLVRLLHDDAGAVDEGSRPALLGEIREYFGRQREREAPLWAVFSGPSF